MDRIVVGHGTEAGTGRAGSADRLSLPYQIETRCSGGRYILSPGFRPKVL